MISELKISKTTNKVTVEIDLTKSDWKLLKDTLFVAMEKMPTAIELYERLGEKYKPKLKLSLCQYACFQMIMKDKNVDVLDKNSDLQGIWYSLIYEEPTLEQPQIEQPQTLLLT